MSTYCRVCGKLMEEGEGDICEVCKESIRAEALGRQRRIAKDTQKGAKKLSVRAGPGTKDENRAPATHDAAEEKKPHHFKSMAEYLAYLKGKE
jgi:hypothetical protein